MVKKKGTGFIKLGDDQIRKLFSDKASSNANNVSESIWDTVKKSVKPIRSNKFASIPKENPEHEKPHKKESDNQKKVKQEIKHKAQKHLSEIEIGKIKDIDGNTASRLKQGKIKQEAALDLHGYTIPEAKKALGKFINSSADSGKRCVKVITGKGLKSKSRATISSLVEGWLNSEEVRKKIITVSYATLSDGGRGAIYILLRKNKSG